MGGVLAAAEPQADLRLGDVLAAQLGGVDRVGADLLQVLAGQRHAGRLGDPAPVGVAAEQRRLDQRRVGDRARDPLGLGGRGGLGDLDPADPDGALAVGTISIASCSSTASSRPSGSGCAGRAGRLQQHGVVGAHLAVDGDPLEGGVDGGAQRGVGVLDDGVGLDEAEHRREVRLDHPRPLRLGGEGHAAGPQGAALRPAVGGEDRVGEGRPARRRRAPPAASPIPARTALDRQRHADRPGLGDGDAARARSPSSSRRPARTSPRRRRAPARRSRRWRCRS